MTAATLVAVLLLLTGCGTTRSSDTLRTATEQLLISDAIDRTVQSVNFESLRGQKVFLDDQRLVEVVDRNYLISSLRQHLLASGCALRDKREEADFIVEARAGAIGTDRNDLLFGVPSMNVPQIMPLQPTPSAIPEIPFAKRRDQRGIVKIAVFAYHRESGAPVWQSGLAHQESSSNDVWILGAGPFQRGTIYDGTEFAGKTFGDERPGTDPAPPRQAINLARAKQFASPDQLTHPPGPVPTPVSAVAQAAHSAPSPVPAPAAVLAPAPAPPPAPLPEPANAKPIEQAPAAAAPLPQPRFSSQ
jgi:hypothetical protein